jgi:uncharacterized RDD family membrane protein YckC
MTQPPPGPGYGPGYVPGPNEFGAAPYPSPYRDGGYGNPYAAGPTGYPPPYPQSYPMPQWNNAQPVANPNLYTPWLDRVLALVIDQVPIFAIIIVGYGLMAVGAVAVEGTTDPRTGDPSGFAIGLLFLAFFGMFAVAVAYWVWNFGYRQGRTGQSIGKKAMKFKVISERTGQPIGFGLSVLRQIAHYLDGIFYIGYLMPLWDSKRQTIADKFMTTVCVPAPVAAVGDGPNPYAYPPR